MKQGCRKKGKNNGGITLIALTVTILVLIILASISIKALTGDNGIIGQSKNAKDSAEIDSEKEVIETSVVQATGKDRYGNITKENMKEYMDKNAGERKTEVIDNGDTLVVKFVESNRYYEVDIDGNTEGPKELINDKNVGDLSKGGKNDGSEEKPFEINCIEDLVTFSIMSNGGNSELGIGSSNFSGKYVVLNRTLDFNSIFSYNDYTTTKYGDLNTDGVIEDIRTELTKKDEGCIGFTPIGNGSSLPYINFDGNNHEILNIYVNISGNAGLFGDVWCAKIKNLGISGKIISTSSTAGGIVGKVFATTSSSINIHKCWNRAEVNGTNDTGGICGYVQIYGDSIIKDCYNEGNITGNTAGGIAGRGCGDLKIINSYNIGKIISKGWGAGGIIGSVYSSSNNVYNCYNQGNIEVLDSAVSYRIAVGIGNVGGNGIIKNCYNIGILKGNGWNNVKNWVIGTGTTGNDENCYYLSGLETYPNSGIDTNATAFTKQESEAVVEKLNQYIDEHKEDETTNTSEWKRWKIGEDGYPTFE